MTLYYNPEKTLAMQIQEAYEKGYQTGYRQGYKDAKEKTE